MKVFSINDICEIKSGKRIPLGFDFVDYKTPHPYIRARDIKNGNINTDDLIFLEENTYNKIKKYIINENDIAITIVGASIGDVGFAQKNVDGFNLTENAVRLTHFNDKANSKYVYYLLIQKQYKELMQTIAGGAAQPKLGIYKIQKIKVCLPSLHDQEKIASILSAYDNLIENNNKRINILEQMAENLYKEWFVRFRFPGHETTPFENGIPKTWKKGELADVCCFLRGKNITSNEMIDGPHPVIAAGLEPSGYHSEANVKGTSITISNSGANAGYISIHYSDIWAADCSYVCESDTKNIFFVYEMLRNLSSVITNMQRGAAQPHVYAKDVNQLKMYLPDEKLMNKANIHFKAFHQQISVLTKQNESLTKQRDLLLPRLMSGKLAV